MLLFLVSFGFSTNLLIEAIDKSGNSHRYASAEYSPGSNIVHMEDFASEPYEKNFIKYFKITREDGVSLITEAPRFDNFVAFKFYLIDETVVQFEVTRSYRRGTAGSLARSHEMQKPVTQENAYSQSGDGPKSPLGIFGSPWFLIAILAFTFLSRGGAQQGGPQGNPAGGAPAAK